jgi:hypothetical protein
MFVIVHYVISFRRERESIRLIFSAFGGALTYLELVAEVFELRGAG